MEPNETAVSQPIAYAVVSAIYNVARYLPDYFASLDAQTFDKTNISVILVDDGSTDDGLKLCREWAYRSDYKVKVVTQENSGQASARNRGLEQLGEQTWVTFIDPDDTVSPDYFQQIDGFIRKNPTAHLVVGNLIDFHEATGEVKNSHPLRHRFKGGDQLVDLLRFPRYFHLSAATAFFKVDELTEHGLKFSTDVRPNFEDGHLIGHYLLDAPKPLVGFVQSAQYMYRRRKDGSSTLQQAGGNPLRYTNVLRYGYLDLLRKASAHSGGIAPEWLQNEILYELAWTFRSEESMFGQTAGIGSDTGEEFHRLVGLIREFIEPEIIEGFDLAPMSTATRDVLINAYTVNRWNSETLYVSDYDIKRSQLRVVYRFIGSQPDELFSVRGKPVRPIAEKTRYHKYLGKTLLYERIIWLPFRGTLTARLDGRASAIEFSPPPRKRLFLRPYTAEKLLSRSGDASKRRAKARKFKQDLPISTAIAQLVARMPFIQSRLSDAWVLMDRDINANDNAEHLFRYLRAKRRRINAWFVVKKGTGDWKRLKDAGYKRVIPFGSFRWKVLCLCASKIVSSHADSYVYYPFARRGYWDWKFVFLQHGVIKDDLSRWLNGKPISGMLTTAQPEYDSVVGDGNNYELTAKEVALTGLPRHDRLRKLSETSGSKNLILVMPTWRQYLFGSQVRGTAHRELKPDAMESEFVQQWREFLFSARLKQLVEKSNSQLVFVPHPNLAMHRELVDIPDYADLKTYSDFDVQKYLAEARLVITDYSSLAFEAALIRTPVAYFHFDSDRVFGGQHIARAGYFSYESDGFGPVCKTPETLLDAAAYLLERGSLTKTYAERVERFFGERVNDACEAAVRFIREI